MRILIGILIVNLLSFKISGQPWSVSSPDGKISVKVSREPGLSYTVMYDGRTVIENSPLGIVLDNQSFSDDLNFLNQGRNSIDEKYSLMVGKRLQARNYANEMILSFANPTKDG